jgi:hypothetical protein
MTQLETVANAYVQLRNTEGGRHLEKWIEETANAKRRAASKSQDTAYGDLRFADGMEHVLSQIKTMSEAKPQQRSRTP